MLLLDRNNEPTYTVYYLSAVAHKLLSDHPGLDLSSLYHIIENDVVFSEFNFDFLILALDFLFLVGKITIDEKGGLYVH